MLARTRERLSFANVVSLLALFIALGGTSYAAVAITGKNIKDGTVTGKDVKDRSLNSADLAPGTVKQGPPGQPGAPGQPGVVGPLTQVTGPMTLGDPGTTYYPGGTKVTLRSTAQCPQGQRAISGGFVVGYNGDTFVQANQRTDDGTGWTVLGTGYVPHVQAVAYCAA